MIRETIVSSLKDLIISKKNICFLLLSVVCLGSGVSMAYGYEQDVSNEKIRIKREKSKIAASVENLEAQLRFFANELLHADPKSVKAIEAKIKQKIAEISEAAIQYEKLGWRAGEIQDQGLVNQLSELSTNLFNNLENFVTDQEDELKVARTRDIISARFEKDLERAGEDEDMSEEQILKAKDEIDKDVKKLEPELRRLKEELEQLPEYQAFKQEMR